MGPDNNVDRYCIWAVENVLSGPVDLRTLVRWVEEERVAPDTWIHLKDQNTWQKAAQIEQLKRFFPPRPSVAGAATLGAPDGTSLSLSPRALRRVRILAGLSERQLERFMEFMQLQPVRQWTEIVKQGSPGDAMYLVLEGEVRVRTMIADKERILVTLAPGEFFGEVSILDCGPRSADVIANQDSLLLKISAVAFQKLINEAPDLAAPFLYALSRTLVARIRADNKRYRDSVTIPGAVR